MDLHVILRTCSESSVHFKERFIPVSKTELIEQCLRSTIVSLEHLGSNENIMLTVIDDHSSEACIDSIKDMLQTCAFKTEFIPLEGTGNNTSMKKWYEIARASSADLIYLLEDDYLHTPECIPEMIESYLYFKSKISAQKGAPAEVAIMPVDNAFHYYDNTMFSSPLVLGMRRHWRVNYYSNGTLLLGRESIERHWSAWIKFSEYRLDKPETHEDATLAPIFRSSLHLFTPIPTLALHVAGHNYISPFTDWEKMWNEVTALWHKRSEQ